MLIVYFLFGLGVATAHSDYGVSFRAQNFDEKVKSIDKEAYINHQREKRFATGHFVHQNLTNRPTWGSKSSREFAANVTRFMINGTRPSSAQVFHPGQPGYVTPSNNTGTTLLILRPNGTVTNVTRGYVNPGNYNTNFTRSVYPYYLHNATSNSTGYPVRPVTPPYMPYPGYPGYPAPNAVYPPPNNVYPAPNNATVYPAPNNVYPAQNNVYPAPNNVFPAPNNVYPAPNNVYPAPNNVYPAPNTVYPAPNNVYPAPNNVYPAPNTMHPAPNNVTVYPAPNNGYPAPNNVYPAPNNVYPAPNNVYPPQNTVYPAPNNVYPAPNNVYPAPNNVYPAPNNVYPAPNNVYPAPNTVYPAPNNTFPFYPRPANTTGFGPKPNPNSGNGFNNTASLANCKCNLPRANSTITKEERTMDACIIACNDCPAGMRRSAFGMCVKDEEYEDY